MSLSPGHRVGSYVISASLGAGGMGEVYRARDAELGRDVAIKALPESVAHDPDRIARFEREAKLLASLNHPNIAGIHGVEKSGDAKFLILELVEGASLADRLRDGPIPVIEAARIARQIAEALEAAHEKGIVHRDLKPANIMLTADDQVKVLDFGLAKAFETAQDSGLKAQGDLTQSPTLTSPATAMGLILGTAAYMAPEQAKGRAADKRSDLWAFGCVFYEMLTGTRAFQGDDISEILAAVIRGEPDWTSLPSDTPAAIRRLLRRCLAKDRAARIPDAAVARIEIDEALGSPASAESAAGPAPVSRASKGRVVAFVAVAGAAAFVSGFAVWALTRPGAPNVAQIGRFPVFPSDVLLTSAAVQRFAIASDGRHIVYNSTSRSGTRELYVRALDQLESVPVRGAENAGSVFLSPDGEWVGYNDTAAGSLRKIRIRSGAPVTICELPSATGGFGGATWGANGLIVFATNAAAGLMKVPDTGGVAEPLTTPEGARHILPRFLPRGEALLFTIVRPGAPEEVAALSLATGEITALLPGSQPRYSASGHLLFVRERAVWAVAFDSARLAVTGQAVQVLEDILLAGLEQTSAQLDLSESGTMVYSPAGAEQAPRQLVWVDRQGREEVIPDVPPRAYVYPRLSPDGRSIALDVRDQQQDIWTWDLDRSVLTRITTDPAPDRNPVWAPDGRRIAFWSSRAIPAAIFWQAADGTGAPERLTEGGIAMAPMTFTPDGARLVLREQLGGNTGIDLALLTIGGKRSSEPLIRTSASESNAALSANGRWVAHQSGNAIWVRPFPDVEQGRWQIAVGSQPLWSRDGRELFFLGTDGRLMGVSVQTSPSFVASSPKLLLDRAYVWNVVGAPAQTYDVSLDGRRFLMIKPVENAPGSDVPQLVAVLNWHEELRRLAPAGK